MNPLQWTEQSSSPPLQWCGVLNFSYPVDSTVGVRARARPCPCPILWASETNRMQRLDKSLVLMTCLRTGTAALGPDFPPLSQGERGKKMDPMDPMDPMDKMNGRWTRWAWWLDRRRPKRMACPLSPPSTASTHSVHKVHCPPLSPQVQPERNQTSQCLNHTTASKFPVLALEARLPVGCDVTVLLSRMVQGTATLGTVSLGTGD